MVGVQGVTSTSAQVRWDLGRLSAAYVVWMYQIQYNCTADETLIYRSVQLWRCNTHYSLCNQKGANVKYYFYSSYCSRYLPMLSPCSNRFSSICNHKSFLTVCHPQKGGYPVFMQNSLNIYPLQHDTSVVQLFTLYMDGWIAQGKDEWGDR